MNINSVYCDTHQHSFIVLSPHKFVVNGDIYYSRIYMHRLLTARGYGSPRQFVWLDGRSFKKVSKTFAVHNMCACVEAMSHAGCFRSNHLALIPRSHFTTRMVVLANEAEAAEVDPRHKIAFICN